ncbi:hypothetical protein [Arthrobacter sp. KNU40]|uniref:hypothetical protein n=1 Tax=Arthrobacter sp. KNU40 TaxID=3447965 RepID=UPI003F62EA5A
MLLEENLTGKFPGLYGRRKNEVSAQSTYVCYMSSAYLDAHVRADPTAVVISMADPRLRRQPERDACEARH